MRNNDSSLLDQQTIAESTSKTNQSALRAVLGGGFKVLAAIVIITSFAVWVYAFSGFAGRDKPDLFDGSLLAPAAEKICASAIDDVEAMPEAVEAESAAARAIQIRATTDRFEVMVDELSALSTTTPRDTEIMGGWLDDWRTLLADRFEYADTLEVDADAQFSISSTGGRERLDRRIRRLANTNNMPSCADPQDVA